MILRIAVPVPIHKLFDYSLDAKPSELNPQWIGRRVRVTFGSRILVGIIMGISNDSHFDPNKIKPIMKILDDAPVIDTFQLTLCEWMSQYYHAPIGEVVSIFLPKLLREGYSCEYRQLRNWVLTPHGTTLDENHFMRSIKQLSAWKIIQSHAGLSDADLRFLGISGSTIKQLEQKNIIEASYTNQLPKTPVQRRDNALTLNSEQQTVLDTFMEHSNSFSVMLLDGITGSGKTEVYLQAIQSVLEKDKQILVLIPEIGLTPQTLFRFSSRFQLPIAILHSKLTDRERLDNWLIARDGVAKIIIGTRSALFAPLQNLGLIIIDEEHDSSFKQQEGFRYHARDVAIKLAHIRNIPILLGSATPSIESLYNIDQGKFIHCRLTQRAGGATPPKIQTIDLRAQKTVFGISPSLKIEIESTLKLGNQVLLFINRRGYSPVIFCHDCGWIHKCTSCESAMTMHNQPRCCLCHHCLKTTSIPKQCYNCQSNNIFPIGYGTERIEEYLQTCFPDTEVLRIDQDSTRKKGSMQNYLTSIHDGKPQILLGTQMLAKGHHFPDVTLVGILDADSGIYSTDFRALEKLGQLILQVSGRAGRGDKPGQVIIQTHHPHHPLLQCLIEEGYHTFTKRLCEERDMAQLPPFTHLAIFRSQAVNPDDNFEILNHIKSIAAKYLNTHVQILGPVPAPMEKRANYYRAQLLLKSPHRKALHQLLTQTLGELNSLRVKRGIKWSLDVDPIDLF